MHENTAHPLEAVRDAGLLLMSVSHRYVSVLLDGIEGDGWYLRPSVGANHALWTLAHLAWEATDLGATARVPVDRPAWGGRFATGSVCSDDRASQPAPDEVREAYERTYEALRDGLASLGPERLAVPPGELGETFPNVAHVPGLLVAHEMSHTGTFRDVRRLMRAGGP